MENIGRNLGCLSLVALAVISTWGFWPAPEAKIEAIMSEQVEKGRQAECAAMRREAAEHWDRYVDRGDIARDNLTPEGREIETEKMEEMQREIEARCGGK